MYKKYMHESNKSTLSAALEAYDSYGAEITMEAVMDGMDFVLEDGTDGKQKSLLSRIYHFILDIIKKIGSIIKKLFLKIRAFFTGKLSDDFRIGGLYFPDPNGYSSALREFNHVINKFNELVSKIFAVNAINGDPNQVDASYSEFVETAEDMLTNAKDSVAVHGNVDKCTIVVSNTENSAKFSALMANFDQEQKAIETNLKSTLDSVNSRSTQYSDSGSPVSINDAVKYLQNVTKEVIRMVVADTNTISKALIHVKKDTEDGNVKPATTHYYDANGANQI